MFLIGDKALYDAFDGDLEATQNYLVKQFYIVKDFYEDRLNTLDPAYKFEIRYLGPDPDPTIPPFTPNPYNVITDESPYQLYDGERKFFPLNAINFFRYRNPCYLIGPDIIHVVSGLSYGQAPNGKSFYGYSTGIENTTVSISCQPNAKNVDLQEPSSEANKIFKNRLLHEVGHDLGLIHLEYYNVPGLCNNDTYLMCEDAEQGLVLSGLDFNRLKSELTNQQYVDQVKFPARIPSTNCEITDPITLETKIVPGICAVNAIPRTDVDLLAPCPGRNQMEVTLTVTNDCNDADRIIRLEYNSDVLDFISSEPAGFIVANPSSPQTTRILEYRINGTETPFFFTKLEERVFIFQFSFKGSTFSGWAGCTAYVFDANGTPLVPNSIITNNSLNTLSVPYARTIDVTDPKVFSVNGDDLGQAIVAAYIPNVPLYFEKAYYNPNLRNIIFGPGVTMVSSYNGLKFSNVTFEGCESMWQGIEVRNGKSIDLTECTISDAQYGVNLYNNARLNAQKSVFRDNNVAIFSMPESGGAAAITLHSNTIFTSEAGLKPPFTPAPGYYHPNQLPLPNGGIGLAGIYVKNAANLTLDRIAFEPHNEISNFKFGIYAENTAVNVRNGLFKDIKNLPLGPGYNAFINPFTPKGTAISVRKGSLNAATSSTLRIQNSNVGIQANGASLNVQQNFMDEVNIGLQDILSNSSAIIKNNTIRTKNIGLGSLYRYGGAFNITENTVTIEAGTSANIGIGASGFDISPNLSGNIANNIVSMEAGEAGIHVSAAKGLTIVDNTLQTAAATRYGIRVEGGDLNNVKCNDISGAAVGNAAAPATGIYGLMSGRTNYTCNTVSASNFGMRLDGVAIGKSDKISVAGNTFSATTTGLELGADAVIGAQTHQGNKWSGTMTQAVHLGGILAANQSLFTVDAVENPEFLPGFVNPIGWFVNVSTPQNSFTCIQGLNCPLPALVGSDVLDRAIADGSLNGLAHQDAQLWLARRRLYERLTGEDNPYTNDSHFQRFLLDAQSNGIAAYADMQQGIRQLFQVSATDRNLLDAWDAQLATLADTFAGMERRRALDTLAYADSLALENLRSQTLDTIIYIQAQRSQKLANLQAARSFGATALLGQNNALGGAASYQLNEKAVNDVLLRTVAMGLDSFSAAQQQTLSDIAEQCPLADGEAVLRARALRSLYHTAPVLYTDICNEDRERKESAKPQAAVLNLFPNPASQMVYLDYRIESGEARFELWNTLGQVMKNVSLNAADNFGGVSTAELPGGIYVYRLMIADKLVQSGTLSIQR